MTLPHIPHRSTTLLVASSLAAGLAFAPPALAGDECDDDCPTTTVTVTTPSPAPPPVTVTTQTPAPPPVTVTTQTPAPPPVTVTTPAPAPVAAQDAKPRTRTKVVVKKVRTVVRAKPAPVVAAAAPARPVVLPRGGVQAGLGGAATASDHPNNPLGVLGHGLAGGALALAGLGVRLRAGRR
jgi:outer membrane biosynthesis protein TonB